MSTIPNHRLDDLLRDPNSGELGDMAAQLADARYRIGELTAELHSTKGKVRESGKRWQPIEVHQVVIGDIVKVDNKPVRVVNVEVGGASIRIVNDRFRIDEQYSTDVYRKHWLIEVWR